MFYDFLYEAFYFKPLNLTVVFSIVAKLAFVPPPWTPLDFDPLDLVLKDDSFFDKCFDLLSF